MTEDEFNGEEEEAKTEFSSYSTNLNSVIYSNSSSGTNINTSGSYTTYNGGNTCTSCNAWYPFGEYHSCTVWYPQYWGYYPSYKSCPYCKAINHDTAEACSRVKSVEYHENGHIKSIKFHKDKG